MKKSHVFIFILTIISLTISQYSLTLSALLPRPIPPIHPDKSLSTLFNESSIVIQGIVESSRKTGETDEVYQYETTVIVEEYLRGNGSDKINVHYQNIKPEIAYRYERFYVYFLPDEKVVLCLQNYEDHFVLTYGVLGKFSFNQKVYVNINGRIWSPPTNDDYLYLGFLFLLSIPTYIYMYRRLSK